MAAITRYVPAWGYAGRLLGSFAGKVAIVLLPTKATLTDAATATATLADAATATATLTDAATATATLTETIAPT